MSEALVCMLSLRLPSLIALAAHRLFAYLLLLPG